MIMQALILFFSILSVFLSTPLPATYQQYDGGWVKEKFVPYLSLDEHLNLARSALQNQQWSLAEHHFQIILHASTEADTYSEAILGCSQSEYHLQKYEEANTHLDTYVKELQRDQRYRAVMELKYQIAQAFREGAKRRLFGWSSMPKILSGKDIALQIYDEIAAALPRSDLAAQSLLAKAQMLRRTRQFSLSSQAFQQLISEFDRHPLVLQAFQEQARNYLVEMRTTSRNEELLELARINRQKMATRFPNADFVRIDADIQTMRELYAQSLFESAQLYDKKGKKEASQLYLGRLMRLYGDTKVAPQAQQAIDRGHF